MWVNILGWIWWGGWNTTYVDLWLGPRAWLKLKKKNWVKTIDIFELFDDYPEKQSNLERIIASYVWIVPEDIQIDSLHELNMSRLSATSIQNIIRDIALYNVWVWMYYQAHIPDLIERFNTTGRLYVYKNKDIEFRKEIALCFGDYLEVIDE